MEINIGLIELPPVQNKQEHVFPANLLHELIEKRTYHSLHFRQNHCGSVQSTNYSRIKKKSYQYFDQSQIIPETIQCGTSNQLHIAATATGDASFSTLVGKSQLSQIQISLTGYFCTLHNHINNLNTINNWTDINKTVAVEINN